METEKVSNFEMHDKKSVFKIEKNGEIKSCQVLPGQSDLPSFQIKAKMKFKSCDNLKES